MIRSLGKITTAASTPVAVTTLVPAFENPLQAHAVLIQALPDNTGKIYIGNADMVVATLAGVYAVLPASSASAIPAFAAALEASRNGIAMNDLYVAAETGDEGVLVTVLIN